MNSDLLGLKLHLSRKAGCLGGAVQEFSSASQFWRKTFLVLGIIFLIAYFFWPAFSWTYFASSSPPQTSPAQVRPKQAKKEKGPEVSLYRLKIGQPEELRGQEITVKAGRVYNLRTGKESSWAGMLADLGRVRYIYVGETHTSLPMHLVQARVIEELVKKGYPVSVGLEMLPTTIQEVLTRWQWGILTEREFLQESTWYDNWSYNFGYYRPILKLIKDYQLPFYGLNVPRAWITQVRLKGRDSLTAEQKKYIPPLDLGLQEHRLLIRAMFTAAGVSPGMKAAAEKVFEGFYRAQVAWDETMAYQAWLALQKETLRPRRVLGEASIPEKEASSAGAKGGTNKLAKLVVLAGSGHLLYKLGLNYRLNRRAPAPARTIICVEVPSQKGEVVVARTLADYVIGLTEEEKEAFPTIGLSLKKVKGLSNLVVSRSPLMGVAKKAGLKKGDIILEVDGQCFQGTHELYHYLSQKKYGDEVTMVILREGERLVVTLKY